MRRRTDLIGIDIGYSSVKVVHISRVKRTVTCRVEPRERFFKETAKGLPLEVSRVHAAVNPVESMTRIVTIPVLPRAEIAEALRWEMGKHVSFSPDDLHLGYEVLGQVNERGARKQRVAVACIPVGVLDEYLRMLHRTGITPETIILPGFACKNILSSLGGGESMPAMMLDIGAQTSELSVFDGGRLSFCRTLSLGGDHFTQGMLHVLVSAAGKIQLGAEEAEGIKMRYGLPDKADDGVLEGSLTGMQLLSLLRPQVERLGLEVERTLDFYRERAGGAAVERIVLLGGGSSLKNLIPALSHRLGMKVVLGDPVREWGRKMNYRVSVPEGTGHRFASALAAAVHPRTGINLLPQSLRPGAYPHLNRLILCGCAALSVASVVVGYQGARIRLSEYRQRMLAVERELVSINTMRRKAQRNEYLKKQADARLYWSDILREIGNRIPAQLRLTGMHTRGNEMLLEGEIRASGTAFEKTITGFMRSLEEGLVKKATLITTGQTPSPSSIYNFELSLEVE